jgi:hypothetical protein
MEIAPSQLGPAIQLAVQSQVLDQAKAQGASVAALIASAPSPAGSVNLPGQGTLIDALA